MSRRRKSDRELFPFDNSKAYAKLQPKRDIFGRVFMELS